MVKETVEWPDTKLKSFASIKTLIESLTETSLMGLNLWILFLIKLTTTKDVVALNAV